MRKTVAVEALKDKVNKMILNLPDTNTAGREALQTLIENVLMDSGNYHGFQYLDARDMRASAGGGTTVGINDIEESGKGRNELYELRFKDTDRSRVKYF